jgi:aryl-alcohol dehydrogenase-like predicted oxidoreductase
VVIVSITDTSSGIEVITYVLVSSNNVLPLDAFMEAMRDAINSGIYEAAGFSSVTAEPIEQPTSLAGNLSAGSIAAIVISMLCVIFVILVLGAIFLLV